MESDPVIDFNIYFNKNIDIETVKARLVSEGITPGYCGQLVSVAHCTTLKSRYETLFSQRVRVDTQVGYCSDNKPTIPSHLQDLIEDVVLEDILPSVENTFYFRDQK